MYKKIKWTSSGYGIETEMVVSIVKQKISYTQVPIKTIYLESFKGLNMFDGLKIVLEFFKWIITK